MHDYDATKQMVLDHMQKMFEEIEAEAVMSHQEKYALLEDAFENATDTDELRVAFDQWYMDHAEDIGLDMLADEIWDQALSGEGSSPDAYISDDDDFDFEEEDDQSEDEDLEKEI
ncbi:MAG: hypothetical protein V1848_01920 [Candidatus Magasanikbacteria bacterium]